MRVLITTDSVGGVWDHACTLARALHAHGHAAVLAHVGPPLTKARHREAEDIDIVEGRFPLEWMPGGLERAAACRAWLKDVAARHGCDLVHCNAYSHVAPDAVVPQFVVGHSSLHGWWEAVHPDRSPPEAWEAYRDAVHAGLRHADLVAAPSRAMLDELRRCYDAPDGLVVHNGIAHASMAPTAPHPGAREPMVLTGGRLWDEGKGHAVLDEAAAGLPWPVHATGQEQGPGGKARFRRIRPLGFLPRQALRQALGHAAVYANPARYEPFGLGALEAASEGCALVLSDLPSQREVWGDAALYAAPGDANDWHEVLRAVILDDDLRRRMAGLAQERARRYDVEAMVQGYLQAYGQVKAVLA